MFKRKRTITICGGINYTVGIDHIINTRKVKTYGVVETLVIGGMFYTTVVTNISANKVAELLEAELKTRTRIQGSIIFLEEES